MNPVETHEITELIGELRDRGRHTILLIEHDMHVVEGISDRRHRARPRRQDRRGHRSRTVANDPKVIEAYLGSEEPSE